ncbi:hypothetical protein [Brevibacillus parabrevis]|uniref:hypothetical protein n=1 Tax=Brevibacillus parabrevis TaxID=54914 RepID=UPI002E1B7F87|nr:hypothetical protein [Brevibacillus parabrevis]
MYQVYIPFSSKDVEWNEDNKLWLLPHPTAFEFDYPFEIQRETLDLSPCEKQLGKPVTITFQYDERIEVTEEYRNELAQQEQD